MKKYLYLLFICLLFAQHTKAQCTEDASWDWEDQTPANWPPDYNFPSQNISPAFTNGSGQMEIITLSGDYKKTDGWILLRRRLGCSAHVEQYPYFILYNKYRSIIRVFAYYNATTLANGSMFELEHQSSAYTSSTLNFVKPIALATDKYSTASNTDKGVFKTQHLDPGWFFGDFPVAFDPTISSKNAVWQLYIYAVNKSTISLKGTEELSTFDANDENIGVSSASNNTKDQATKSSSSRLTETISNYNDFKDKVDSVQNILNKSNLPNVPAIQDLADKFSSFLNLGKDSAINNILKDAGTVGSIIKVSSDLFSFITGTTSKDAAGNVNFIPTVTHGTISLSGTIENDADFLPISQTLPGGAKVIDNAPLFDCPLGIMAVTVTPKINQKDCGGLYYPNCPSPPDVNTSCDMPPTIQKVNFKSYQVQNDIAVALNGANIDILDLTNAKIEACLEVTMKNQTVLQYENVTTALNPDNSVTTTVNTKTYDMFSIENFVSGADVIYDGCTLQQTDGGPTYTSIACPVEGASFFSNIYKNKEYILEGPAVNDSGKVSKNRFMLRTPFRNISCLKNTSITLPDSSSIVGVKVRAIFQRKDDPNKPVIYMITIKPDITSITTDYIPYPISSNQTTLEDIDLGTTTLNSSQAYASVNTITSANTISGSGVNVSYTAGQSIDLNPGFDANANNSVTFDASIQSFACGTDNITIVPATHKFTTTGSSRIGHFDSKPQTNNSDNTFNAYPNPFTNDLKLQFSLAQSAKANITIYNSLMQPVATVEQDYEGGSHEFTQQMDALPAGVYLIVFKADGYRAAKKVVKT